MREPQDITEVDLPSRGKTTRQREAALRRWVGGQLKQRSCRVPDPVWAALKGIVSDLLEADDPAARRELRTAAHAALADYRAKKRRKVARKRRRSTRPDLPSPETIGRSVDLSRCLDAQEVKRQQLLTRELLRIAEKLPNPKTVLRAPGGIPFLQQTRDDFLGGRTLSESEARNLTESVGASVFELEFFRANGIPLIGHESRLLTPRNVTAPGADSRSGLSPDSKIEFRWHDGSFIAKVGHRLQRGTRSSTIKTQRMRVAVESSVMFQIEIRAMYLAFELPWAEHDAAWFILTGAPPTAHAIVIGPTWVYHGPGYELAHVDLTIQPWLSSSAVLKAYKQLQRILIGHRNRPPRAKSLELFDFVSEQRHNGATWPEAMKAWTAGHPTARKRYPAADEDSARRFASHFRDVARQVLRPFEDGAYSLRRLYEEAKP